MAVATAEAEFHGFDLCVAASLPDELKPIEVNLDRARQQIDEDFPELTPRDWSRVMVYATHAEEAGNMGGLCVERRELSHLSNKLHAKMHGIKAYRKFKKIINDKDLLIVVDLTDNPDYALPHEIRHAADFLTNANKRDKVLRKIRLSTTMSMLGLGSFLAGVEVPLGTDKYRLVDTMVLGGFALCSGGIILNKILAKKFDKAVAEEENRANDYAKEVQSDWVGIISTGSSAQ